MSVFTDDPAYTRRRDRRAALASAKRWTYAGLLLGVVAVFTLMPALGGSDDDGVEPKPIHWYGVWRALERGVMAALCFKAAQWEDEIAERLAEASPEEA